MNKVYEFLYRGHDITIAHIEEGGYTFGWNHENRSIISQHGFGKIEDAIAEAKTVMDRYVYLMNLVTIKEHIIEEVS